jgi:hypothetical protein
LKNAIQPQKPPILCSSLWLCAELWTDVFSMFSRADLVQRVEPVHRRFKEICEKKVRTIHLIRTADRFIDGLAKNMAEANQQYAHLAANDCPLAHQFRLIQMDIWVSRREAETNSAAYKVSYCRRKIPNPINRLFSAGVASKCV